MSYIEERIIAYRDQEREWLYRDTSRLAVRVAITIREGVRGTMKSFPAVPHEGDDQGEN